MAAQIYAMKYEVKWPEAINARDIHNMCCCLEYQSCEDPGWEDTLGIKIIRRLKKRAAEIALAKPTRVSVEWEFIDNSVPPRRVSAMYRIHRIAKAALKRAA